MRRLCLPFYMICIVSNTTEWSFIKFGTRSTLNVVKFNFDPHQSNTTHTLCEAH
jgi:hypothetical protein